MTSSFNVVVGSGVGGYKAAIRAGQLGLRVAGVEKDAALGGTCPNVGCMPSKALLHASEQCEAARTQFAALGIKVDPQRDLETLMAPKRESVAGLARGVELLFRKNKVDLLRQRRAHHGARPCPPFFRMDGACAALS